MKLLIDWSPLCDKETDDIFTRERFSPCNFTTNADGYLSCELEVDDEEFDRLELYWTNPFVWSPA